MRYAKLSSEELQSIVESSAGDRRRRAFKELADRVGCRFLPGWLVVLPFDTADGRYQKGQRGFVSYVSESPAHFGVQFFGSDSIAIRVDAPDGSHPLAFEVCLTVHEWYECQAAEHEGSEARRAGEAVRASDPDADWLLREDVEISPLAAPKLKEKIERIADLPGSEPMLSLDLGNAYSKVASDRWLNSDLSMEFRSISGRLSKARRHGDYRSPLVFTFEGESWVFGDDVRRLCDAEPTFYTDMSRYTSGFYRRLAAASFWLALSHLAGQGLVVPRVVSSIPVQEFSDGRADLVRQTLAGEYLISSLDGETLHLDLHPENLTIIPEGVGAYTLALSQAVGAGSREVAVIDVGFYTSDFTVFDRGVYVSGSAASAKIGIGQVAEKVTAFLRRDYRYNGDVWAVDARLDDGCIQIGRECVQFSDVRDAAYSDLVDDLVRFYFSKRGSRVPAVVLLTGGKSGALYPFLSDDLLASSSWRVMGARGNVDGGLLFLQKKAARS